MIHCPCRQPHVNDRDGHTLACDREAGRLICRCTTPAPTALPPWNAIECGHCHRPVPLATVSVTP